MLRRISNCHNSGTHRLPPETLATVASHLEVKSLMAASRVCHFWRSTLLSFPRLWSYLDFNKRRRALVFLARSKFAPVSVELPWNGELSGAIKEALEGVTDRLISLQGNLGLPLNEYLDQPLPMLKWLNVYEPDDLLSKRLVLPSLRSLTTRGFTFPLFHVPHLVVFFCEVWYHPTIPGKLGDSFLDFFRSCPLLQVISLSYGNTYETDEFTTEEAYTEAVSLPHLRSFTHKTLGDRIYVGLFNRLSIPPTCEVTFSVTISDPSLVNTKPWTHLFPNPRNPSYLTDVKKVTVTGDAKDMRTAKFQNSENMKISLTTKLAHPAHVDSGMKQLLDFLESSGIMHSLDTLEFRHYPDFLSWGETPSNILYRLRQFRSLKTLVLWQCGPLPYLKNPSPPRVWCPSVENLTICTAHREKDVLERLGKIAISRQEHGVPLKRVTLFLGNLESLLQAYGGEVEGLNSCVESVKVVNLHG